MPSSEVFAPTAPTSKAFRFLPAQISALVQSSCHFSYHSDGLRRSILLIAGLGMVVSVSTFQKLLVQIYQICWQMSLIFALIGLMTVLLLGQNCFSSEPYPDQQQSVSHWTILSCTTVILLGIGILGCILITPPVL